MKHSIVIVTSSGEFRNLHLPGRDRGGGSSIELKSFEPGFHRRLVRDLFWRGGGGSSRVARSLQRISTSSREIHLRGNRRVCLSPLGFLPGGLTAARNGLHGGEKNRAKNVIG